MNSVNIVSKIDFIQIIGLKSKPSNRGTTNYPSHTFLSMEKRSFVLSRLLHLHNCLCSVVLLLCVKNDNHDYDVSHDDGR